MKAKIFSDQSFLPKQDRYVTLLYPFWGLIPELQDDKDTDRFGGYSRLRKGVSPWLLFVRYGSCNITL